MKESRNIRITIEYDGTNYAGWQIQKKRRTVQGELVRAVREVTGNKVTLYGAGRTDAGVHAEAQAANFHTNSRLSAEKWPNALNAHLSEDIAVRSAEDVPSDFHAQHSAKGKIYRYLVLNQRVRSALYRGAAHLVRPALDLGPMQTAAATLVGQHDFRSFGTRSSQKENTERILTRLDIYRREPFLSFTLEGNGFLYNMVRTIVGSLLEVGMGNRPPGWIAEVLNARDRKQAGKNVPPTGLTLIRVIYE